MQVDENQEDRGKGETGTACLPPPRESKSAQWLCSPGVNTMYCPDWNHTMNNKLCKWHCAVSISITLTHVSFQNSSYPIPLQWNIMKKNYTVTNRCQIMWPLHPNLGHLWRPLIADSIDEQHNDYMMNRPYLCNETSSKDTVTNHCQKVWPLHPN